MRHTYQPAEAAICQKETPQASQKITAKGKNLTAKENEYNYFKAFQKCL